MDATLNPAEQAGLAECESIIERGRGFFVTVGLSLARIRNERLYRDKYETFEAYLRERWEFGRAHGHRLIEAATVVEALSGDEEVKTLSPRGDKPPLPASEAHVRRLIQLRPEDRPKAWKAAVELAHGKEITVKILKLALEPFEKPKAKQKVAGRPAPSGSALAMVNEIEKAVRSGQEQAKILDLLQALKRALIAVVRPKIDSPGSAHKNPCIRGIAA